ncbi:50S ribosomal protein L20 [Psychrosphaera haliotis]|uniref:Large ribosomal subunit protein bL20 n=1 Tax=Psychrosphaera haliotis TaxID=555083 RepID=A0A6N8F900_9GAMM|nr:50S ribosomal protein L20 [Psychrosphaera haliotis]
MARVNGCTSSQESQKVLKAAKGYYGARSRVYRVAFQAVQKQVNMHTVTSSKETCFPSIMDCSYQCSARQNGLSYGKFMNGLKRRLLK